MSDREGIRKLACFSIEAAARLLADARRPVILAGGGVIAAGASPELITLAERIGAPVTTFMGKGAIPEDRGLFAYPLDDLGSIPDNRLTPPPTSSSPLAAGSGTGAARRTATA